MTSIWNYVSLYGPEDEGKDGCFFIPIEYVKQIAAQAWPDCDVVQDGNRFTAVRNSAKVQ